MAARRPADERLGLFARLDRRALVGVQRRGRAPSENGAVRTSFREQRMEEWTVALLKQTGDPIAVGRRQPPPTEERRSTRFVA